MNLCVCNNLHVVDSVLEEETDMGSVCVNSFLVYLGHCERAKMILPGWGEKKEKKQHYYWMSSTQLSENTIFPQLQ